MLTLIDTRLADNEKKILTWDQAKAEESVRRQAALRSLQARRRQSVETQSVCDEDDS
jgi:hypothetical protein